MSTCFLWAPQTRCLKTFFLRFPHGFLIPTHTYNKHYHQQYFKTLPVINVAYSATRIYFNFHQGVVMPPPHELHLRDSICLSGSCLVHHSISWQRREGAWWLLLPAWQSHSWYGVNLQELEARRKWLFRFMIADVESVNSHWQSVWQRGKQCIA